MGDQYNATEVTYSCPKCPWEETFRLEDGGKIGGPPSKTHTCGNPDCGWSGEMRDGIERVD